MSLVRISNQLIVYCVFLNFCYNYFQFNEAFIVCGFIFDLIFSNNNVINKLLGWRFYSFFGSISPISLYVSLATWYSHDILLVLHTVFIISIMLNILRFYIFWVHFILIPPYFMVVYISRRGLHRIINSLCMKKLRLSLNLLLN